MWSLTQPAISGHKYRLTSREGDRKNQAESPHNAGVMSQQPNDSSQPKQKGSNKRHMAPSSQLSSCASMTVRLWHHSHSHMMPPWPCETKHTVWTTSGSTEHQQQRAWVFMSGGGATADLGGRGLINNWTKTTLFTNFDGTGSDFMEATTSSCLNSVDLRVILLSNVTWSYRWCCTIITTSASYMSWN